MFVLRIIFFRLYESPRYLVAAGRKDEAIAALQNIEDYNIKYVSRYMRSELDATTCFSLGSVVNPPALDSWLPSQMYATQDQAQC